LRVAHVLAFLLGRHPGQRSGTILAAVALGLSTLPSLLGCDVGPLVAFPGAQGFGALSVGGRGGRVIEVTNLDDIDPATGKAAPGSLRAAIEATGPRIVVFRVSGTINVCERNQGLEIDSPYITIAGQTAPGDGITLRLDPSCDGPALRIWEHDVVLRHLRIRPGSNPDVDLGGSDAITIGGANAHDIIIDHCSLSWATDEDLDVSWGAHDVTVQYSIVSEGLKDAPRPRATEGPSGGYGMLIDDSNSTGSHTDRISVHHVLFAHNWYRNPQVTTDGLIDYRNNVIYDWGLHGVRIMDLYGPTRMNLVGNYAKEGPSASSTTRLREMWAYHSIGLPPLSYFVHDNLGPRRPSTDSPETDIIYCREHNDAVPNSGVDCDPARFATATPFVVPHVTTWTATSAYDDVLANAGATRPRRDAVDLRVVDDVRNGTGGTVTDPAAVGGWPFMASATPPVDSDHDGMPDAWELLYGLNVDSASDAGLDADADGYTNVEEFLNSTSPLHDDR
jgi:pectate lyase